MAWFSLSRMSRQANIFTGGNKTCVHERGAGVGWCFAVLVIKNMDQTCAHCRATYNKNNNWNKASSCCSRDCSDALDRRCANETCKRLFNRKTSPCSYFCSMRCGHEYNVSQNYTIFPLLSSLARQFYRTSLSA